MVSGSISFTHPMIGIAALAIGVLAIAMGVVRRIAVSKAAGIFLGVGILLVAAAAGGPVWNHPKRGEIVVMVDLSPSTRGAKFRDAGFVRERVRELIGDAQYQLIGFGAENRELDVSGPFVEMGCEWTIFSPPGADAILLFSDGRFEMPGRSAPVYVVVDPGLENVADAKVVRANVRGGEVSATIANSGTTRPAMIGGSAVNVPTGTFIFSQRVPRADESERVEVRGGDLWPENDSLVADAAAPWHSQRWWVGSGAPKGWRGFASGQLPVEAEAYLSPAVIVIDDQAAEDFSPVGMDRLMQYVRDLGGAILISGGNRAFARGGYQGTALEEISPLASFPPEARERWMLLADGSGSMSQAMASGETRWEAATGAIVAVLGKLPPGDRVLIGQFADTAHWWMGETSAAEAAKVKLPPTEFFPHGPTNLESSLIQIAQQSDKKMPTELLMVSDCDAVISQPGVLKNLLMQKKIRLFVLAIDRGSALETIRGIAAATGGSLMLEMDAGKWVEGVRKLSEAARPDLFSEKAIEVIGEGGGKSMGTEVVPAWNTTWLKLDAEMWGEMALTDSIHPMAAQWRVGSGVAAALGFEEKPARIEQWAKLIEQRPRDPRFVVRVEAGSTIHVMVDAVEGKRYLNGLGMTMEIYSEEAKRSVVLGQTGPGRYELSIDAPARGEVGILRSGEEMVDGISLPAHYPAEFDAVGNDRQAMRKLAEMSGGRVIELGDKGEIVFRWPVVATEIGSWICALGIVLMGIGVFIAVRK